MDTIIARLKPCNCGCHGQDPWHKSTYRRVVRDIRQIDDTHQEGQIRLPQSTQPVRVVREGFYSDQHHRVLYFGWVVDRSSIVNDKV